MRQQLFIVLITLLLAGQRGYSQDHLPSFIDSLMTTTFKSNEPGGVVLVAKKGVIIYKKAFGMNKELGILMKEDMSFGIASNTKQFTAVSILQLFEKGKLDLQDTIGKFLSCPPPAGAITIQQLLSQTSGLGEKIDSPMRFKAGSRWEYNNENYQVLGRILEKVTGSPYSDYLDKNIFKPAAMLNSSIGKDNPAFAAGGIQSTAEDLFKWNQALKSGKIIKAETIQLAYSPQPLPNGKKTAYGFGWRLSELKGSPLIWHGGLITGYTSQTLYFPKEDIYLVILLDTDSEKIPLIAISRLMGAMSIDKPYRWTELKRDENDLQQYTGVYKTGAGEPANIFIQDGQLFFQRPNGRKLKIKYAGNDEFFFEENYYRIQFYKDSPDKISQFIFSQFDQIAIKWSKADGGQQ